MTWRFNRRQMDEGERVNDLLKFVEGLTYADKRVAAKEKPPLKRRKTE